MPNDDRDHGTGRPGPRRVRVVPSGPLLIEGPVEIVLGDGSTITADRFVVALCLCRLSRRYPLCDTSHRRRGRRDRSGERRQGDAQG